MECASGGIGNDSCPTQILYANECNGGIFGYIIAALSFTFFNINTHYVLPLIAPKSAKQNDAQLWKWRNTANSLLHSFVSGSWAIVSFWQLPELRHNLINAYTISTLALVSVSVGYFIYDFFDMALNHRSKSTYELLLHHLLVTVCFGLSLVTRHYHGYALVALLVEINSVFLHIRQLFIIQGWKKDEPLYRINAYINIATFIVFRLINLGWLIRWVSVNRDKFGISTMTLAYTAELTILIMNIMMFIKILNKDFASSTELTSLNKKKI